MFTDIPAQLLELGIFFDEAFHVGDGFKRRLGLGFGLIVFDERLDRGAKVSKVVVEVGGEERV